MESLVALNGNVFTPQPKHAISTGENHHLMGGILHAIGILASPKNVIHCQTTFLNTGKTDEPIHIDLQTSDNHSYITLKQSNNTIISRSITLHSSKPISNIGTIKPIEIPEFTPKDWDWNWGNNTDILNYMTGYFRRQGALMWFKNHPMDLAAIATLCDFGGIQLVAKIGQFGKTMMLDTHLTGTLPTEKSYVTSTLEAQTNGALIIKLDQYNEQGHPVALTRHLAKVTDLDRNWEQTQPTIQTKFAKMQKKGWRYG